MFLIICEMAPTSRVKKVHMSMVPHINAPQLTNDAGELWPNNWTNCSRPRSCQTGSFSQKCIS